jgi:transposase
VGVDRFPVAKLYRACADRVRKKERPRLQQELPPQEYASRKGARWACRKNPAALEAPEQALLKRVFAYAPELARAYAYREQLPAIFAAALSKEEATKKLQEWQPPVSASGLRCSERCLKTLDTWRDEIPTYFRTRPNSGFVAGLNNKIKVLKRRC